MILQDIQGKALGTIGTVQNTYDLVSDCVEKNIKGAFVECGVFAGAHIAVMSLAGDGRRIYAFDSFKGIPYGGSRNDVQPGIGVNTNAEGKLESTGISVQSVEDVKHNLGQWGIEDDNIHYIKGWFQHTTKRINPRRIAVLRLDGDLYESTIVCLKNLYPRVQKGGYVIVDDYSLKGCHDAVHEYFDTMPEINNVHDANGVIWFKK